MFVERLLVFSMLLVSLPGCSRAAQATRPDDATASEAIGERGERCEEADRIGEANPFVVDWTDTDRGYLEATMDTGVAVVHYDCNGMKLLRRCRVEGDYAYSPISRKDTVVAMRDEATLGANFSGNLAQIPVGAEAEVRSGRALHLAYAVVGIESTSLFSVARPQLEGQCDEATHFVFGTARGAFAMRTGSSGEAYSAAQVFEFAGTNVSASASKDTSTSDGDLQACDSASQTDLKSVPGCQALVRVELVPIDDAPQASVGGTALLGRRDVRGCPQGFQWVDGVCVDPSEAKGPHLCPHDDFEGCIEQCEQGSQASCGRLGRIMAGQPGQLNGAVEAWRAFDTKDNEPKVAGWLSAFDAACESGEGPACYAAFLAAQRRERSGGTAVTGEEQLRYYELGCRAGEPNSCLGFIPMTSSPSAARIKRWRDAAEASCRAGSAVSCLYLGWGLTAVWRNTVTPDVAVASQAFERACDGGAWEGCVSAMMLAMDEKGCGAAMSANASLKSTSFPQVDQLSSISSLCRFGDTDAEAAARYRELSCRHGAGQPLCGG